MNAARALLALFALIYIGLGIWCAVATETTATALGYELRTSSGRSEYFTVYVGLDLALGICFLLGALNPRRTEPAAGLAFVSSLLLASCRGWTFLQGWITTNTVIALFATEITLTVVGFVAWRLSRGAAKVA